MPKVDITASVPPLPEGWSGSPDDLFEFFAENAVFSFEGDFPTGQIGGTRPTEDIGIWYGDNSIEKFINGAYQPISDVPVGALFMWASPLGNAADGQAGSPPENYLSCNGRSLVRADYPALYAVIGVTWGMDSSTTFNLPDFRGRGPIGPGIGDYAKATPAVIGKMKEVTLGQLIGQEWVLRAPIPINAPVAAMKDIATGGAHSMFLGVRNPSTVIGFIIRYK